MGGTDGTGGTGGLAGTDGTGEVRRQVFLGWDPDGGRRCWSQPEDSVGVVGPPRYGKTSGLVVPSVLCWDGPVVCTSTRGDVLAFAGDQRARVAAPRGGRVFVYDPFGSEHPDLSMRWSPLSGCDDPAVCYRRVAAMTAVSGQGMTDGDHWRAGAAGVMRGYFHAAALQRLPLATVRRWLARQEVDHAVAILEGSGSPAAMWADDLTAVGLLGDRERGSFYAVARNTLEATAEPTVLESCSDTDLDVDTFLRSSSSLFVIGPSHHQQAVAPLVAGLVDSVAQRAAEMAARQGGRLDPPLLLALDEVANIAPLQSLPSLVSEGGGRGVVTMWAGRGSANGTRWAPGTPSARRGDRPCRSARCNNSRRSGPGCSTAASRRGWSTRTRPAPCRGSPPCAASPRPRTVHARPGEIRDRRRTPLRPAPGAVPTAPAPTRGPSPLDSRTAMTEVFSPGWRL